MDTLKLQKGADAVLERLTRAMDTGNGVHPQSLVCALGTLAGYGCQEDTRIIYMKQKGLAEDVVFNVMQDKQGNRFFFGDLLNEPLVNQPYCVWSMIGGAVKKAGGRLPDLNDIIRYVSFVAGSERFGVVRNCETGMTVTEYLSQLWTPMKELAYSFCQEGELHIIFGIALQKAVYLCRDSADITECARVAMESAAFASKTDRK